MCRFIKKHPQLNEVIDEVVGETCDLAVAKLMEKIGEGDLTAIRYYLDNKGQGHGFGQRKLAFKDGDGTVHVPGTFIETPKVVDINDWRARFAPDQPDAQAG